jgi:hypothetical protein
MTDRELLEAAAKAAGIERIEWHDYEAGNPTGYAGGHVLDRLYRPGSGTSWWNPLTDDGDALRLAVRLGISVLQFPACIGTKWPQNGLPARLIGFDPPHEDISSGQDVLAATRRAIVRAAAEIGRAMK